MSTPLWNVSITVDTSYAGLVVEENVLWISYYSSHEGNASIYFDKLFLSGGGNNSPFFPGARTGPYGPYGPLLPPAGYRR